MVPFIYDDLKSLVKSILQLYIKQSVVDNCPNGIACKKLNKSNIVNKKKLTLTCATELAITELVEKDIATSVEIEALKTECLTFLITTTQKIFEHSCLGSTTVGYASFLNPPNLNHPSVPTFFKSLISRLVYLNILQPKLGDTALSQFTSFIENCVKGNPENVSSFNRNEQRIDYFYFNEMKNLCCYSDFC